MVRTPEVPIITGIKPILEMDVHVRSISVSGNARMKLQYFQNELKELDRFRGNPSKLREQISIAQSRLTSTGLFDEVEIKVVPLDSYDVQMEVMVKEKGIPFLKIESNVKANSGLSNDVGFEVQGALRSPLGLGEFVRLTVGSGSSGSQNNSLVATAPLYINDKPYRGHISLRSSSENNSYYLSYKQKISNILAMIETVGGRSNHSFSCEIAHRDEIPINYTNIPHQQAYNVSSAVLYNLASSSKVLAKYSWFFDTRDSAANPSNGKFINSSVEVALPPGSAQFLRSEITLQNHQTLGPSVFDQPGLVGSVCGHLGVIYPLNREKSLHVSDRYHNGGPMSIRGFDYYGVGARGDPNTGGNINGDSVGGMSKLNLIALLSMPIPQKTAAAAGGRVFVHCNIGSIGPLVYWKSSNFLTPNIFGLAFDNLRASLGGGVSFQIMNSIRLEMSYSLPLLRASHDVLKPFQIGVGMTIN